MSETTLVKFNEDNFVTFSGMIFALPNEEKLKTLNRTTKITKIFHSTHFFFSSITSNALRLIFSS